MWPLFCHTASCKRTLAFVTTFRHESSESARHNFTMWALSCTTFCGLPGLQRRRPENVAQLRAHIGKLCRALSEDLCRKVVTNARGCAAKRWSHWTCSSLGTIFQPMRINSVPDVKCFYNNKNVLCAQSMVWHFVCHPVYKYHHQRGVRMLKLQANWM